MAANAVMCGVRFSAASWKMCWMRRRSGRCTNAEGLIAPMSTPSNRICRPVGSISRETRRPSVLLPDPLSPTTPRLSPLPMSKLMLSSARHRGCLPAAPPEDLAERGDRQHSGCLQATRWSEATVEPAAAETASQSGWCLPAARRKPARQERRRQIGKLALNDVQIVGRARMLRRGGQKLGRVGVPRRSGQRRARRALDDLAGVHHRRCGGSRPRQAGDYA